MLAWRLPDRARLDGPEGDERALENPPGARHGEIGGSHGGGHEEEHRKERERERERRWRVRACTLGGTTETEVETKKEKLRTGEEGAEVSISRGDPINDGALSDAFATRFNTSVSLIRKKKFHPIVLLPILLIYRLGTIKYRST